MAQGYVNSADIRVFPATRRDEEYQRQSRLFTEKNVVDIINRLVDKENYVVSVAAEANKPFEFVLHGYYFRVDAIEDILNIFVDSGYTNIYAWIELDTGTEFDELAGQDDEGKYLGVGFSNTISPEWRTSDNIYYLNILQKDTTTTPPSFKVPEESFVIFDEKSIFIDIDGGIL